MEHRARWAVPVLASALALSLPLAACDDDDASGGLFTYGMPLSEYGGEVTLGDGTRARVDVRDGQEVVVQWWTEDAGWRRPSTVYREADHWIHEAPRLAVAGGTLAINPDYWEDEELADDFPPDHSVQLICRRLACTDGVRTTGDELEITHLSPDGRHACFRTDEDTAVLWSVDDGEREAAVEGDCAD